VFNGGLWYFRCVVLLQPYVTLTGDGYNNLFKMNINYGLQ
jgi:hypothetical protein